MYSKYLSKKLTDRMKELSGLDKFNLEEELKLMRIAALDVVQTYDAVATLEGNEHQAAKVSAGLIMREALEAVIDAADKIASVEAKRNDKLDIGTLHVVVNQIVEKAHKVFGEDNIDLIRAFADECREIRLPSDEAKGTTITPDQDVLEMDSTVPREA